MPFLRCLQLVLGKNYNVHTEEWDSILPCDLIFNCPSQRFYTQKMLPNPISEFYSIRSTNLIMKLYYCMNTTTSQNQILCYMEIPSVKQDWLPSSWLKKISPAHPFCIYSFPLLYELWFKKETIWEVFNVSSIQCSCG